MARASTGRAAESDILLPAPGEPRRGPGLGVVPRAGVAAPADVRGDEAVAIVATAQHGVIGGEQLAACGLGAAAIHHRTTTKRLHRLYRSAYAVGHAAVSFEGRLMAAVVSVGPGSFVSHHSAARVHDALPAGTPDHVGRTLIDVSVTGRNVRPRPGLRIHRVGALDARDLRWHGPIPVSSGARTVLDVAETEDRRTVERLAAAVLRGRLATEADIRSLLARSPGRAGLGVVAAVLGAGRPPFDRSVAERLLLDLLRRAALPEPETNARAGPYEVDGLWADLRVAVEFDSFTYHGDRAGFRADRRKIAELQALGYDVVPVVWEDLTGRPEVVVAIVSAVLAVARERLR